jgi:distribution and morphology protein 10
MMGHISTAYAARVSRDLCLSSRFDFNVYSYESEWRMGAEWWMRRKPSAGPEEVARPRAPRESPSSMADIADDVYGVVKARASTNYVCIHDFGVFTILMCMPKDVSLMWEGRLKNMLVSLGVVSDFSNRTKPIRGIGLELSYFSSG